MSDTLADSVIRIRREIDEVTENWVLNCFDLDKCREFDKRGLTDSVIRHKTSLCINYLRHAKADHSSLYDNAFNAYNEIIIYDLLSQKCNIKHVKENEKPTPDYIITTKNGHQLNIDLKTVSFNEGEVNLRQLQKQFTESKIIIEEESSKKKTGVIYGKEVTVSPLRKSGKDIHMHRKGVIESIRDKTANAYKPKQLEFEGRNGILLIDTIVWDFPIFLQEALPYFLFPPNHYLTSGCLWHSCFGKIGERTFNDVESPYHPNIGLELSKNGILQDIETLKAVIYTIHKGNERKFVGFHKIQMEDDGLLEALWEICDFVNDDFNTHCHLIPIML